MFTQFCVSMRELANQDSRHRSGAEDKQHNGADHAVHRQSDDGQIGAGDSEKDCEVIRPSPAATSLRRPLDSVIGGAREQHRSNAEHKAEDPSNLSGRMGAQNRAMELPRNTGRPIAWSQPRKCGVVDGDSIAWSRVILEG